MSVKGRHNKACGLEGGLHRYEGEYVMEVKSASTALQLNSAASAVENGSSGGNNRQHTRKIEAVLLEEKPEQEEESVKVSISAAGMRESLKLEKQAAKEEMASATEIEEMMKKMEGLSSQVINGNFSMTDRLNFQREIKELTLELSRAGGNGISFTKNDNVQLSQKMNDLTRMINEAAVYHRNASAVFMVKNRQTAGMQRTFLDIAI